MYISEKLQIFICDFPKLKSKCFSSQIILALGKQTNKQNSKFAMSDHEKGVYLSRQKHSSLVSILTQVSHSQPLFWLRITLESV